MPSWTTSTTFVAGNTLTAAQLNTYLSDNTQYLYDLLHTAWTSYTPTLTQSGAVSKTVTRARYIQIGKTVIFAVDLACTGSGTGGNAVQIGLPVTAAASGTTPCGSGWIFDTSTSTNYKGIAYQLSTSVVALVGNGGVLGASEFTAALASGDAVRVSGIYEAA